MRKIFKFDDCDTFYYCAKNKENALLMHVEQCGYENLKELQEETCLDDINEIISVLGDNEILKIRNQDDDTIDIKTAREWANEDEGPIASSLI